MEQLCISQTLSLVTMKAAAVHQMKTETINANYMY
jgi:hypothetical protein